MSDFLLEIGTEEIPAGMIQGLAEELTKRTRDGLGECGIHVATPSFIAAPRRIGFILSGLPERQEDRQEAVVGPALSIAKDAQGNWTKAAEGFAKKQGIALADCTEVQGPKGLCIGFTREVMGRATAELLAEIIPAAVDALYLPKAMTWGNGEYVFVRPVRWVVALLDDQVVPLVIKGVAAGRTSRGHRIWGEESAEVASAAAYFDSLRKQRVLADPDERRTKIEAELNQLAHEVDGVWDANSASELVNTLVFTCEYPTVFLGNIPQVYTTLPEPIFSTCLREHQKSFAVYVRAEGPFPTSVPLTEKGLALRPHFLAIMDGLTDTGGLARKGNENVVISRLKDAEFFFEHDKKVPLERRLEELRGIVYHPKLGSYHDKAMRMEKYARELAPYFGADPVKAGRAAKLCKCDLASLLVQEKEFTALQGVAGGLYAEAQGEAPEVAAAIKEHYDPYPPMSGVTMAVALADKLDTLMEFFRIGQAPTGSKDPFAMRRAGLKIVQLLATSGLNGRGEYERFSVGEFIGEKVPACREALEAFLLDRARYEWERRHPAVQGPPTADMGSFTYDEVNAIFAGGLTDLFDMLRRLNDLHVVRHEHPDDFDHLSAACKRVRNILKGLPEQDLDPALFKPESDKEGAAERALYAAYQAVHKDAEALLDKRDYAGALRLMATLRPAVDRFFDDVLVMVDPEGKDSAKTALQNNRLAFLQRLIGLLNRVADFSEIVPREEKKA